MARLLHLGEVIKFAIKRKQENYQHYKSLSAQSTDPKLKVILEALMLDAERREDVYAELLQGISGHQTPGVQEDEEYLAYVEHLLSAHSKTEPLTLDEIESPEDVVAHAISADKKSMLFYKFLKDFVHTDFHAQIDDVIATEAVRHISLV